MIIELKDNQVSTILNVMHSDYISNKKYFNEHPNDVQGLVNPEEIRDTYNCILGQANQEGELSFLTPLS